MANPNFTLKLQLAEANEVEAALRERLQRIASKPIRDMTEEEKLSAGRLDTILRRDFT
jgi:hypothetical protein